MSQLFQARNILFNGLLFLLLSGCTAPESENQKLIDQMDYSLKNELLNVWYPVSLDTVYGGFLPDFSYDWKPDGPQNKMIVTQTRHVWTTSQAAMFYDAEDYRDIARHGFHFLKEKMWDDTYGGFYMLRDRQGGPIQSNNGYEKSAYGNAFAIYALSSYYAMSGDTSALNLAKRTFLWLEEHSYDPHFKGYFDRLSRDGSPIPDFTWKDQNSSIHLLEAFAELYRVWPDNLLRQRLFEMLTLIRDTITNEKGYLVLYFEKDWTPVSFRDSSEAVRMENIYYDHVSFGHDVETGYLMLEASFVLGLESDLLTLKIAKRMIDHALANGWDNEKGGFYDQGYYFKDSNSITILSKSKIWWVEAEGLNALLLMSKLFPDEQKYENAFKKQWEYIDTYLIDHDNGGWYSEGLDESPEQRTSPKGSVWKINYHNMRSLLNCIKMLRAEHELISTH